MISSIVVTGCYNIGVNGAGKIKVDDNTVLSVNKEIPFVRYRFNEYNDEQINYIKSMKEKFSKSIHLAEVQLQSGVDTVAVIEKIKAIGDIAVFVYVNITDDVVANACFDNTVVDGLKALKGIDVDRICMKDMSRSLDTIAAMKLTNQLAGVMGLKADSFALCSSPLSFDGRACLTAVRARELMSKYNASSDMALPCANHQCMNNCGCIRYMVINNDLEAPAEVVKGGSKKSATSKPKKSAEGTDGDEAKAEKKSAKPAKKKQCVVPGMFNL